MKWSFLQWYENFSSWCPRKWLFYAWSRCFCFQYWFSGSKPGACNIVSNAIALIMTGARPGHGTYLSNFEFGQRPLYNSSCNQWLMCKWHKVLVSIQTTRVHSKWYIKCKTQEQCLCAQLTSLIKTNCTYTRNHNLRHPHQIGNCKNNKTPPSSYLPLPHLPTPLSSNSKSSRLRYSITPFSLFRKQHAKKVWYIETYSKLRDPDPQVVQIPQLGQAGVDNHFHLQ